MVMPPPSIPRYIPRPECALCKGSGMVFRHTLSGPLSILCSECIREPVTGPNSCAWCNGTGFTDADVMCRACEGTGQSTKPAGGVA